MKYRREAVAEKVGMASSERTRNGQDLDRNLRTGVLLSWMVEADLALLSKILFEHGTMAHSR